MVVGVFVRHSHPAGYGSTSPWKGEHGHRAHGYSVILVECETDDELAAVKQKLAWPGLPEPLGHKWDWYGGAMDHVATLEGNPPDSEVHVTMPFNEQGRGRRISVGDNRFVGVYKAAEILEC